MHIPDWLQTAINLWFLITVCRWAWNVRKLMLVNRDGHSGRYPRWWDNDLEITQR